jgi:S-adenosylmethionine decarboxylase
MSNPLLITSLDHRLVGVEHRRRIGWHLLADLSGVAPERLRDEAYLRNVFRQALIQAGCTILTEVSHAFPPPEAGVTGMFLLSESHAAFHTYPEHGYLAMDLFVCGQVDPHGILDTLRQELEAPCVAMQCIERMVVQERCGEPSGEPSEPRSGMV